MQKIDFKSHILQILLTSEYWRQSNTAFIKKIIKVVITREW